MFENGIVQSVLATIIVAFLAWVYRKIHFLNDEKKIYKFIDNSSERFRSTNAIVSGTNLVFSRVQHVSSKSSSNYSPLCSNKTLTQTS